MLHAKQTLPDSGFGVLTQYFQKLGNTFFVVVYLLMKNNLVGFYNGKIKRCLRNVDTNKIVKLHNFTSKNETSWPTVRHLQYLANGPRTRISI